MDRRSFIAWAGAAFAAGPRNALGQERTTQLRMGCLSISPIGTPSSGAKSFIAGIARLGFVEGRNLVVDVAGFGLLGDRLDAHAKEIAAAGVDIIVAFSGDVAIRAALGATRTIPVLGIADDMVGSGFVASLARPAGNLTGLSIQSTELDGKRQDLLLEAVPGARRIAAFVDTASEGPRRIADHVRAAQMRGVAVDVIRISRLEDAVPALDRAKAAGCEGVNVTASPLFFAASMRTEFLARCKALGLAAIFHVPEMAQAGGLMAYGARFSRMYGEQLPRLFQKLAAGLPPSQVPIEMPSRIDLVINLGVARAIGLNVPESLLAQASEVVDPA